MARLTVLTAVYGGYDDLHEPVGQTVDVDWLCVTDNPQLRSATWRIVHEPAAPGRPPRLAAKAPKMRPDRYCDTPASVWIDASVQIRSGTFAADMVDHVSRFDLAQFVHPDRDCIYAEADASKPLAKYHREPIDEQIETYRAAGHPPRWGLWAAGIIARRHTAATARLGDEWLGEVEQWSVQDQLSLPVVLRRLCMRPEPFPGTLRETPWFRLLPHLRGD